jgi:hypothetical protein
MTSNAGAQYAAQASIGFSGNVSRGEAMLKQVKKTFKPEFINRLSGTVVFNDMDRTMATLILRKKLGELQEKLTARHSDLLFSLLCPADSLQEHFSSYKAKQDKCDPGDHSLKSGEALGNRVHTSPSDHRHEKLKKGKRSGDTKHPFPAHPGILQSICHRYGKGVHGKSHSQQYAFADKYKLTLHAAPSALLVTANSFLHEKPAQDSVPVPVQTLSQKI